MDPTQIRRSILERSKCANVGHIGSCLCVVEVLVALYRGVIRVDSPSDPERDRFILSKGHAGLALYAVLAARKMISLQQLETFCGPNTLLGVHPDAGLPGVDFSTGSLGHGLSFAAGAALAARLQNSDRRAFCLVSDAECNEGSVWEAATFAAHHQLSNLIAIVDCNGQQALGLTKDIADMSNLAERWRAFGWDTQEVDGHDTPALEEAFGRCESSKPHVIIAHTVFGKGVSFMEAGRALSRADLAPGPVNWHYLPMSDMEYDLALTELAHG